MARPYIIRTKKDVLCEHPFFDHHSSMALGFGTNFCSGRQNGIFGNNHDTVFDRISICIIIGADREGFDTHILTDASVFINDGAFNITILPDSDGNLARVIEKISAHQDRN